jgi:hypothetical protein
MPEEVVVETKTRGKVHFGEEVEITVRTQRGSENDCLGYCNGCPQSKVEVRTEGDGTKKKPIQNIIFYFCELPVQNRVIFPRPRGRGMKVELDAEGTV